MPQQVDQFSQDLFYLYSELGSFFKAYDASEYAYCEGLSDYSELLAECELRFDKVRARIKAFAIDSGIQGEFLDEFLNQASQQGLKLAAWSEVAHEGAG